MATVITKTVKPSGGDYTLLSTAVAAITANLVAADEQWRIIVSKFSGGLADSVTMPAITQDATRYVDIKAATGDEYDHVTDAGIYLTASVGFAGVFVNSSSFTRLSGIGFKNTRTLGSGRGVDWFGNDCTISNVYATTASTSGAILFFMNNANNLNISECLSYLGTTGFDFGNNNIRTANKLTSVDASAVGIDTGTADTTITNSLSIGSPDPWLGTFNAASDYNASDGTDAPDNGNSLQNRTTADLANYAGGDFRTASGSALATAGSVDFIGYALESSGSAIEVTPSSINSVSTSSNPAIAFNSVVNISPLSIDSSSAALNPIVTFESILNVSPNSIDSGSTSNDPLISFSSVLNVTPQVIDSDSSSSNPSIQFASVLNLAPNVIDSSSLSLDPVISFTSSLSISPNAIDSQSDSVNPLIEFKSIVNISPNSIDSLSASNNPFISSGQVQTIGNVTVGFKDSGISVKYENDSISVGYKPSAITVNFK